MNRIYIYFFAELLTELAFDQQIGDLLGTEKRLLELHLCKKVKFVQSFSEHKNSGMFVMLA